MSKSPEFGSVADPAKMAPIFSPTTQITNDKTTPRSTAALAQYAARKIPPAMVQQTIAITAEASAPWPPSSAAASRSIDASQPGSPSAIPDTMPGSACGERLAPLIANQARLPHSVTHTRRAVFIPNGRAASNATCCSPGHSSTATKA